VLIDGPSIRNPTPQHSMSKGESSKAAASNGVRANPNAAGGANYELPWYVEAVNTLPRC
jgi:hypothetical protein